jgi:hypothetical protein
MPDLDYFLEQSGLTVPKVKYGQMFALVRAAMVVLELGFPVQASV